MTGYQEILTDPSYCQQLVTLTYSHIGNYGVNSEDNEADRIHAAGLIIKNLPLMHSNFRADSDLTHFLKAQGTVAIADIDTRMLTRHLRERGAQNGAIVAYPAKHVITSEDMAQAVALAKQAPAMNGLDLASKVSVATAYPWHETEWQLGEGYRKLEKASYRVVAYDFGVKRNILRMLAQRGCEVTVMPEFHFVGAGTTGQRQYLVPQTNTEQRDFFGQQSLRGLNCIGARTGVSRAVGKKHAIRLHLQHLLC